MSILIKGMKMPKKCICCPLSHWNKFDELMGCELHQKYIPNAEKEFWEKDRPDWCPLIEVTTPHGDLIDKIALLNHMTNVHKKWQEHPEQHKSIITIVDDELMVNGFPATIEAEDEE